MLPKSSLPVVNDTEKALVLHSSSHRYQPIVQSAAVSPTVDFDLFDSVSRHYRLALLVFGVIVLTGSIWAIRTMRPVYQSEATIFVPPELAREVADGNTSTPYATFVNQQIMTILHYNTLGEALQDLSKEGTPWQAPGETEGAAVERLRSSLEVQRVPDSFEIALRLTGRDPRMTASVVNSVVASFLNEKNRPDASGTLERSAALAREKATLEAELRDKLNTRAKLAESLQVVNLQKGTMLPDDQVLFQMRQGLASAHRKRVEAEEMLAAGENTLSSDAEQIASADPSARTMSLSLMQKQFELREKIKNMLPSHPVRKEAEAELALIDAELKAGPGQDIPKVRAQLLTKLRSDAAEARNVEQRLTREAEHQAATIPNMARNLSQAEFVGGDIARVQDRLSRVESQIEDINLRKSSGGTMRVFSPAEVASAPMKNQQAKALALVFVTALLLGLGLPVLLDLMDARIHDPLTVEKTLGFPVVGMTIARNAKTEQFADEHFRRLVGGIERGIAEGARSVLLIGIKQPVPATLMREISQYLAEHKINVTLDPAQRSADSEARPANSHTKIIGPGVSLIDSPQNLEVALRDAPPLMFSAEAERMAAGADMTFLVVQAGLTTRPELIRGARILEGLSVPAVGAILENVNVERAGRRLRRDLREFQAAQKDIGMLTSSWAG